jgi:hypothetical protein
MFDAIKARYRLYAVFHSTQLTMRLHEQTWGKTPEAQIGEEKKIRNVVFAMFCCTFIVDSLNFGQKKKCGNKISHVQRSKTKNIQKFAR